MWQDRPSGYLSVAKEDGGLWENADEQAYEGCWRCAEPQKPRGSCAQRDGKIMPKGRCTFVGGGWGLWKASLSAVSRSDNFDDNPPTDSHLPESSPFGLPACLLDGVLVPPIIIGRVGGREMN